MRPANVFLIMELSNSRVTVQPAELLQERRYKKAVPDSCNFHRSIVQ